MTRARGLALSLLLAPFLASCVASADLQQPSVAYFVGEGAAAKLAAEVCASCHGEGLAGGRASSLLDDTWRFGGTDTDLALSIRDGRPGTLMPAFEATLDERQIRSLVVLIRELAEKARVESGRVGAPPVGSVFESERHAFKLETVGEGLDTPSIVRGRVHDGAWVDQQLIYEPPADVYR